MKRNKIEISLTMNNIKCHYCDKVCAHLRGLAIHVGKLHKNVFGNKLAHYNQRTNRLLDEFIVPRNTIQGVQGVSTLNTLLENPDFSSYEVGPNGLGRTDGKYNNASDSENCKDLKYLL